MRLTDQQLEDFQNLYKQHYGKDIGREEALEMGSKLIRLIELIYKPMTEAEYQQLQERRQGTGNL